MIQSRLLIAAGIVLLLLGISCAPKKGPIERTHYVLEPSEGPQKLWQTSPGLLSVREFRVSPGYRGKELVYKKENGQSTQDFYNHYFISPGSMLTQATRNWLDESGLFQAVIPFDSHKDPDYILEGTVISMFGDFSDPDNPQGVLRMQFLLLKDTGMDYELITHRTYQANKTMSQPGAQPMIRALNQCLAEILQSLEKDLALAIKPDSPGLWPKITSQATF